MQAIISDVHGNLEALEAVFADIAHHGVDEVYCLGDTVGHGPNPRECFDRIMPVKAMLRGEFEDRVDPGAGHDTWDWSPAIRRQVGWIRHELSMHDPTEDAARHRLEYLSQLRPTHREGPIVFVYGSPRDPLNEYVFPEDVYNFGKIDDIFMRFDRICFCGRTHLPGIVIRTGGQNFEFNSPSDIDSQYDVREDQVLCNVGSVGQTFDGNSRACYVLFDGNLIRFRRVDYDIDATARKLRSDPDFENPPNDP